SESNVRQVRLACGPRAPPCSWTLLIALAREGSEGQLVRVLVTGGAGFIGSHLCDFLLARGCEVVCMDSLVTGTLDNIAHLRDPRFLFVKHDVTNFIVIDGALDYVRHFASPASPTAARSRPSSGRRSPASRSACTATARRRAPSPTSPISSTASGS